MITVFNCIVDVTFIHIHDLTTNRQSWYHVYLII